MNRKPTEETEEIKEEAEYVNAAVCTVDKTAATSDQKFPFFTQSFARMAACWLTLLVIMALRIYFTSVMSENIAKLTAENQNLETQRTWDEARENCKGLNSDLAVVVNEKEKAFISGIRWGSSGINRFWIGLRVKDGKWQWVNGSDLNETSWIPPPTEGHCAISVRNEGWKSVNCGERNRWICKKKA